ncbi:hypothetical protein ACFXPJ_30045, partial [Streptomyces goshikiensis]
LTAVGCGLDFPHAVQAVRVLRHRTDPKSGNCSRQTIYVIMDLTWQQDSPPRPGRLARSQRTIENRLRFVRDTIIGEAPSRIRTGRGPENMAALRSLAISILRAARAPQHRRTPPLHLLRPVRPAPGAPGPPQTHPLEAAQRDFETPLQRILLS